MYCVPFRWGDLPERSVSELLLPFGTFPKGEVQGMGFLTFVLNSVWIVSEFTPDRGQDRLVSADFNFVEGKGQIYSASKFDSVVDVADYMMHQVPLNQRLVYHAVSLKAWKYSDKISPAYASEGSAYFANVIGCMVADDRDRVRSILGTELSVGCNVYIKVNGVETNRFKVKVSSTLEELAIAIMDNYDSFVL